jgi:hypothetical protein
MRGYYAVDDEYVGLVPRQFLKGMNQRQGDEIGFDVASYRFTGIGGCAGAIE